MSIKDEYRRAYSLMRYTVAQDMATSDCSPAKLEQRDTRTEMALLSNEAIGAAWKAHNTNCGDYVPRNRYLELLQTKPQKRWFISVDMWERMTEKERANLKRKMEREYKKDLATWIDGIRARLTPRRDNAQNGTSHHQD